MTADPPASRTDILTGQTFHGRRGRVTNGFRYRVDYLVIDPEAGADGPWPLRRNRAGIVALHDADHGGVPGQGRGAVWVRDLLADESLTTADGPLRLIAQPRILGHVFNPVSFWLCHGQDGSLRAVIAEVSNTFGDRHSYLCAHSDQRPILAQDTLTAAKVFHVSPFQPISGRYEFRFDIRADRIGIWVDFQDAGGGIFTTLTGHRRKATSRDLIRAALRRPLGSRRVLGLIHWQALRLWLKGARYHPRPSPPTDEVSR